MNATPHQCEIMFRSTSFLGCGCMLLLLVSVGAMDLSTRVVLNDGNTMPVYGLGTYRVRVCFHVLCELVQLPVELIMCRRLLARPTLLF